MKSGTNIYEQKNSLIPEAKERDSMAIKYLLYNKVKNLIGIVSTSHNILFYTLDSFDCKKQVFIIYSKIYIHLYIHMLYGKKNNINLLFS